MTAYLIEHPPVRSQFRSPRREDPSGVVAVHTAENIPDYVAFDGGAEAVADFIQGRDTPGSYHELVDSDSFVNLVRWTDEAFHDGTGTNPHSFGLSVATRADVWPLAPKAWRDGAIENAAQRAAAYARWIKAEHGIVIPARRITAAQARARVPGFVTHAELDPTRRTDPGQAFPWAQFLARFAQLTDSPEVPDMDTEQDARLKRVEARLNALVPDLPRKVNLSTGEIAADGVPASLLWRWVRQLVVDDDDPQTIAALVLAGLNPSAIAAAIPSDLAEQVADELAARLADG